MGLIVSFFLYVNINRWMAKTQELIGALKTEAVERAIQLRAGVEEAVIRAMEILQPYLDTLKTALNK